MRKRYNTPHRSRVVKTRMTEEEYAEFTQRLSAYNMSQAEFIRRAITGAAIRPVIHVSAVNEMCIRDSSFSICFATRQMMNTAAGCPSMCAVC